MTDKKVTDLVVATTPLTGTEIVYVVQGGLDTQTTAQDIANLGGGSGTVTSVGLTVPTGLTVTGSPITTSGTIAINFDTGYEIPLSSTLASFLTSVVAGENIAVDNTDPQNPVVSASVQTDGSYIIGTGILGDEIRPRNTNVSQWTNDAGYLVSADLSPYLTSASAAATYQTIITGAATTITSSNLTVNRALISNASGKVAVSTVTDTELSRLSGVTGSVQTQLDARVLDTGDTLNGAYKRTLTTLTDAPTITISLTPNNVYRVVLGGNRTLAFPTNLPPAGDRQPFVLEVVQDGTGGRTLAFNASYVIKADTDINLGPNEITYLGFIATDTIVSLVGNAS